MRAPAPLRRTATAPLMPSLVLAAVAHAALLAWSPWTTAPSLPATPPSPTSLVVRTLEVPAHPDNPPVLKETETAAPTAAGAAQPHRPAPPASAPALSSFEPTPARATAIDAQSPPAGPAVITLGPLRFLPSEQLDMAPRPYSAPDVASLAGVSTSGLPLEAMVLVDESGSVRDVLALGEPSPGDAVWFDRVRTMFLHTRFTPGRLKEHDVAASLRISLQAELIDEPIQ